MPTRSNILTSLVSMKMKAREENLLFQGNGIHKNVCLTPEELDNGNALGHYIWGPNYWTLIPNNKEIIKEKEMELKIEWTRIRDAKLVAYSYYFVQNNAKENAVIKTFCIASWQVGEWKLVGGTSVPYKVTHVCRINGITHAFSRPSYGIGTG